MAYPGRSVRLGDTRTGIVRSVQGRLNEVGCGPIQVDGIFGAATASAVRLFQTRYDLQPDGTVGPITWAALFRESAEPVFEAPSLLLASVLETAASQLHVRETGQNRGPEVDEYLRAVGLDPTQKSHAWCISFVYWCFRQAANRLDVRNPCVRTPGVMKHWAFAPEPARLSAQAALDDPHLVRPGAIFIIDHGHGLGHAGLVARVQAGRIQTIEGNTNLAGSREGDGVHQRARSIASINTGFVDYAR
jgi:hypothetical protein